MLYLDQEAPFFAYIDNDRSLADFQPHNILKYFQDERYDSNTLGSLYVIISQMATYRTNSYCQHRMSHMAFRLAYLDLILAHCKGQGHRHFD